MQCWISTLDQAIQIFWIWRMSEQFQLLNYQLDDCGQFRDSLQTSYSWWLVLIILLQLHTFYLASIIINITYMSKDFFQRNIELMNDLRSEQFKVKEYLSRGKYRMKQKFFNKGKKHYDFDLNSQEYFHQELYDVCFENSEIQEHFNNQLLKLLQEPIQYQHQHPFAIPTLPNRYNQSDLRHTLYRFFNNRANDLQYEKYQIMQRLHNLKAEEEMQFVKSRINLIDKQIQMAINRSDRLSCQDYFEQTYTLGGKPIPINQNGQSIYKYLDQQDCWFSNIHRDDIIIYSRTKLFKRDILQKHFYPLYYQYKYMVKTYGLDLIIENEEQLQKNGQSVKQSALKESNRMINLFEQELQSISPGNLIEKENIISFIYNIFGVQENQLPLNLPLYPSLYLELINSYNAILPYFFKSITLISHKELIALMPKLNNFSAIIFKYQNKEILEGKQQIKLGLQDDIDIKKELHTMLQEIWVNKFVKTNFERYDYRYRIQVVDWPLDTIAQEHLRHKRHHSAVTKDLKGDTSIKQLINIIKSTNYSTFRKHLKKHSQIVLGRIKDKYFHMENINKYNVLTDQEQTLEHLSAFFRIKFNQKETNTKSVLKDSSKLFFQTILNKHIIANPVQIELEQMLRTIKIREIRVKLINVFNGMRCYHRNLALDLRVISNMQFTFLLDDQMLINSNKQSFQNFQKAVKETQTYFSKESVDNQPIKLAEQQFIQHQTYERTKLYKKDKVSCHFFGEQIPHILVSHGKRLKNKILYEIANEDMSQLQQRVLETCTYFINRYQRFIKIKSLDQIVDRVSLLTKIYELQLSYQYQKFKLIQAYYYIYQNTKEPLHAFKISKNIVNLIYKVPDIDFEETSFAYSYELNIEALREELKIVNHLTQNLSTAEEQKCKTFHDKFARSQNIPLTLQAYLYGDLEKRGLKGGNKIQRMNSIVSKISKDSRNKEQKNIKAELQIKQHVDEGDSDDDQEFDLENYDQYLLRKNMDAIFDDMMGGDDNGNVKQTSPVNTVAIQNLVVNPKFEGGPHIKTNIYPQIHVTSQQRLNLVNFTEILYVIGNVRNLIQTLQQQFQAEYGYCSKLYQIGFIKLLAKRMYKTCLNPQQPPPKWISFETDDPYLETVTKSMKYYEETMHPCLDPPSNIQLAIPTTFERHHEKIPPFASLQFLDYHSIDSLIRLKKPVNAFRYKQHNIGINFIQFLSLQDKIWSIQLQRRGLSKSYQNLAHHCQVIIQKSLSQHATTGQSEVFLATQQLKMYNHQINKYPPFSDVVGEVRDYLKCEIADLQVFKKYVEMSKKHLENLLIMKYQIDKPFINKRIDKSRILAPNDPKDIKKIKGRITGMISIRSSQILRHNNFLKLKIPIKTAFQTKFKEISQGNYEDRIEGKQKMTSMCVSILTSKYKRHLQLKLLDAYSRDMMETANKFLVGTQTCRLIKKLNNYVLSVPFLSKIFIAPNQDKLVDNKIFYDQAKHKKLIPLESDVLIDGQIKNVSYIYTLQQYLQEWTNDNNFPIHPHLEKFDTNQKLTQLNPPQTKDLIFKWVFQIPDLHIQANQRDSIKHLINLFHPFTGKLTQLSYKQSSVKMGEPPRNKYLSLMIYYKAIVEYIQANILLISLQIQEDILVSLENIIKKNINFQERYFLTDQNTIRQTINSIQNKDLSVVYNFIINFAQVHKDIKQKMTEKDYIDKKQHWIVHDQITDFIMSKVQGYGLIRKSYLPLYQDLQSLKNYKNNPVQFLKLKTNNIYKCIHISSCEAYLNQINQKESDYYAYFNRINEWLCHCSKLQDYAVCEDNNNRVNIKQTLDEDDSEKQRFSNGLYVSNTNTMVNRLKHLAVVPNVNIQQFIQKLIYKGDQPELSYCHNSQFLLKGIKTFKLMGEKNRLKLFARIRYHYELSDNYISTKSNNMAIMEKQTSKSSFYDLLFTKKVFVLACILFTAKARQPLNAQDFKEVYMELKEVNQIYTHNLYQNLQRFKEENKIQFSKGEINLIGRNQGGNDQQYNKIIKQVLSLKLLREQLRYRILNESLRLLRAQRIPKPQPKRIINTSLIPRVHLITSYSSPLITQRKTYISQQYKLSFLQAFINRFRNKVSRVDLLSSGYGFVITVPDLEDCVNYMNKLLFTFTEKEFKNRIQTFSQYHQILIEAINQKNKTINEQSALIKYLQNKNANLLQAEYLSKVTKLLHEKTIAQDKLLIVENSINGLEDRVRKVVQIQYDKKIEKLQKQNQELKQIFSKVKHLHMINTKQAAKNDFLDIINYYKQKINDLLSKKIDFTISFDNNFSSEKNVKVKEEENREKYRNEEMRENQKYVTEDLQRCKLGEDILFDPYYATKLINKMRLFNIFKMGSKRLKFDEEQFRKNQQLAELHKIQDSVIAQSQREILIRGELSKVQEELSRKCLQLEKLKQTFDGVENQKTKLKILMQSKEKKIEQKDRQIDELKKKLQQKQRAPIPQEKQKHTEQAKETSKLAAFRKEKKYKKVDRTAFLTNLEQQPSQNTLSIYEKYELSNKDSTWREKCEQLYIENKKLLAQLQKYQNATIYQTPKRQGMSLNLRNRRESVSQSTSNKNDPRFPNISYKYNILKQGQY